MSLRAKNDMERGTKITTLLSSLETHIADPVLRLHAIAEQMRAAKDVGAVVKTKDVPRFSETLTPAVAGLGWRVFRDSDLESRGLLPSNLIVSNVPGSPIPIYSAGALISAMYPVPPVVVGQGLNITVMSYLDSIGIGFLCDGDMIKDPWEAAPTRFSRVSMSCADHDWRRSPRTRTCAAKEPPSCPLRPFSTENRESWAAVAVTENAR